MNKHKPPTNYILVDYWNVESRHGPQDFHMSSKTLFNVQVLVTEGSRTKFRKSMRF